MFLELESNNFQNQARLTNERQNDLHLDGHYPNNYFSSEDAENQVYNSPPASDNNCPKYEQSTRNYSQCPGFKYQQLVDTFGKPDEQTEVK